MFSKFVLTASYDFYTNTGTATVTIKGKKNYSGTSVESAVKNTPVVLGQKDATSTTPGYEMDKLSWPMDCAIDNKGRLYLQIQSVCRSR